MDTDKRIKKIEECLKKGNFEKARAYTNDFENLTFYIKAGYLFKQYRQWSDSVNLFKKALKMDSKNKIIKQEIEFLMGILKLEQLDIYASTNLNKDPWLN